MCSDKTNQYNKKVYNTIADLYVIDKLSIPKACAKVGITKKTYYNICKKLGHSSIVRIKDARLNFISNANNIDEHNCDN